MLKERNRLGSIKHEWVSLENIALDMRLSVIASEDSSFCSHNGFDFGAIKNALADNTRLRGGSTISQQVAKNLFLWPDRSWIRKGFEAGFTILIEIFWPKSRILEVYLNIAEFDTGVFGIEAAAYYHFGVPARNLTTTQSARLAAVLPNPKAYSAINPSPYLQRKSQKIKAGVRLLKNTSRGNCVQL